MTVDPKGKFPKPAWYSPDAVSELEKTLLPEWFDGSAPHRTMETYLAAREHIIEMSDQLSNRFVTATMVRRTIPGDVGSLLRLHSFLTTHSLINEDAQNDSSPTPIVAQQFEEKSNVERKNWGSQAMLDRLVEAVVLQSQDSSKRRKVDDGDGYCCVVDWEAVAKAVGRGMSAADCERQFLSMPMQPPPPQQQQTERSITPDATAMMDHQKASAASGADSDQDALRNAIRTEIFEEIVDKSDSKVVSAVVSAALRASSDGRFDEAQRAAITGLVASQAVEEARSAEDAVGHILSEIVDLRMKKLENRLSLLDDVEGMLEAERVALELERRDLYTARCRHWFGGP